MKSTARYMNKLLLLGVLVALVSMAVSMNVFGLYVSGEEHESNSFSHRLETPEVDFSKVELRLPY